MSMTSFYQWGSSDHKKIKLCLLWSQKIRREKGRNTKVKFDAPKPKEKNQQQEESFGSNKQKNKGNQGKEKVKCSYCGKGFHPEHSCMKKNLDEMTSLLERNNINLLESVRKRDNQDRDTQQERGHALMESTWKPKYFPIDSGDLNHMMESRDSFSSLDTDKIIPIHMGDDSTIISKGKGTLNIEHGSFFDVMYVPSLASNILSVYKMNHTRVPK